MVVHGNSFFEEKTGAISFPIYQSATFCHPALNQSTGYDYSRLQNPTREELEKTLANLEDGKYGFAFSSGMAAISTVLSLISPGGHVIVSDDIYGGTYRIFEEVYKRYGIEFTYVDSSDISQIESAIVLTPYFCKPLNLGADIVVHSGTKYLGGHNDTLAGFIIVDSHDLAEKLRFIQKSEGAVLSPFDSWLVLRGIKTLAIRLEKQQQTALKIANWLKQHNSVQKVYYTGLLEHKGFEISKKQASGFGAMISFEVDSVERVEALLHKVKIILFAESLGGVESLITYPMVQTHSAIPAELRERIGINEKLVRLSVGIENADDLIGDLNQALE